MSILLCHVYNVNISEHMLCQVLGTAKTNKKCWSQTFNRGSTKYKFIWEKVEKYIQIIIQAGLGEGVGAIKNNIK